MHSLSSFADLQKYWEFIKPAQAQEVPLKQKSKNLGNTKFENQATNLF